MAENNVVLKVTLSKVRKMLDVHRKQCKMRSYIIAVYIRGQTTKSLQLSKNTFSIIADEVTGEHDNKEVLCICFAIC